MQKLTEMWLFVIVVLVKEVLCVQSWSEYTVAVVEFYPEQSVDLEHQERLERNLDGYLKILKEVAENYNTDIVVFPEGTLSFNAKLETRDDYLSYAVEIPDKNNSLCTPTTDSYILHLSCAARQYRTYLVINLYEKTPCDSSKCSWNFYSTNVVFDRNGRVALKYRKHNIIGEKYVSVMRYPSLPGFDTDFGVSFGSFIGFDILFKEPALDLVNSKFTHIIYPHLWYSQLPFLTSLQVQQQWAYVTNAVLLSSGTNSPLNGCGGSGIYQGTDGPLVFDILRNKSKVFVAKVSKNRSSSEVVVEDIDTRAKEMDQFHLEAAYLNGYTSKVLELGEDLVNAVVCSLTLCCTFKMLLKWSNVEPTKNYYVYHMVAFKRPLKLHDYHTETEVCGLIACVGETIDTCGKRFSDYDNVTWPVTFNKIQIKATFENDKENIQFPNSLLSDIRPVPVDAIEWKSTTSVGKIKRTYSLIKPQNRLMTFAIYGQQLSHTWYSRSNTIVSKLTFLVLFIVFCQ